MTKEMVYRNAAVEITEIFKYLDKNLKDKIPQDVIEHYDKIKNNEYKFEIKKSLPLEEQGFLPETINIFSYIFLKYCCDENTRNNLIKAANAQRELINKQINAKYDFSLLHPKEEKVERVDTTEEVTSLTTMESVHWYDKVFSKIKSFFKNIFGK